MAKFKKGQSGNPGGRPKQDPAFSKLAVSKSTEALKTVIEIMDKSPSDETRLKAAKLIMEYAVGKPKQELYANIKNEDRGADYDIKELAKLAGYEKTAKGVKCNTEKK